VSGELAAHSPADLDSLFSQERPRRIQTVSFPRVADPFSSRRNIEGVKEIYKGSITVTDANKSHEDVSEEIMHRVLKLKHSKGPSRPQRIILMGTPGCGKEKYAQRIADEHELVYI
jgi:pantothenate kinase